MVYSMKWHGRERPAVLPGLSEWRRWSRLGFPGKGQRMRINRQGGELKRQALVAVERAQLAVVKGGLKADRVQGTDPSNPGGN
jgi:hypothetical protein